MKRAFLERIFMEEIIRVLDYVAAIIQLFIATYQLLK
jgi:hypothetical protein